MILCFLAFWCKGAWASHNGNWHSWKNWRHHYVHHLPPDKQVQQMEGLACSSSTFLAASLITDWIKELIGISLALVILGCFFLLDNMMCQSWLLFLVVYCRTLQAITPMKHSLYTNTVITVESAMLATKSDYLVLKFVMILINKRKHFI